MKLSARFDDKMASLSKTLSSKIEASTKEVSALAGKVGAYNQYYIFMPAEVQRT